MRYLLSLLMAPLEEEGGISPGGSSDPFLAALEKAEQEERMNSDEPNPLPQEVPIEQAPPPAKTKTVPKLKVPGTPEEIFDPALLEGLEPLPQDSPEEVEEEEEVPEEVVAQGPKSVTRWKELKQAEKERDQLRRDLEELRQKGDGATSAQVQQLTQALDAQEKELFAARVESSRVYREQVEQPLAQLEADIRGFFREEERAEEAIRALLIPDAAEREAKLSELVDDLPRVSQAKFLKAITEVEETFQRRDKLRADSKAAWQQLQEEETRQTERARQQQAQAVTAEIDPLVATVAKRAGLDLKDPTIRTAVDHLRAAPLALTETQPRGQAYAMVSAALLPHVLAAQQRLVEELAEARQALAELGTVQPGSVGRTSTPSGPSTPGQGEIPTPPPGMDVFTHSLNRAIQEGRVVV